MITSFEISDSSIYVYKEYLKDYKILIGFFNDLI